VRDGALRGRVVSRLNSRTHHSVHRVSTGPDRGAPDLPWCR
jgi:hypothetical protein